MPRLGRDFFAREALAVVRDLLGCTLVHVTDGQRVAGRVVEVEAYTGWDDPASHGHRGRTPRNAVMFGPAGVSYVYFCYGVHWMLNVVARPPGVDYPAAILLRAVQPVEGLEIIAGRRRGRPQSEWTNGPARLTQALGIDRRQDGLDMTRPDSTLYFEPGQPVAEEAVRRGPRIGINVPEPARSYPWRLWIADNPYVSRGR